MYNCKIDNTKKHTTEIKQNTHEQVNAPKPSSFPLIQIKNVSKRK